MSKAGDIRTGIKNVISASVTVPNVRIVDNLPNAPNLAFSYPWILLGDMNVDPDEDTFVPRSVNRYTFYWDLFIGIGSGQSIDNATQSFDTVYEIWEQFLKGLAQDNSLGDRVIKVKPGSTVMNGVWGVRGDHETSVMLQLEIQTKGLGG